MKIRGAVLGLAAGAVLLAAAPAGRGRAQAASQIAQPGAAGATATSAQRGVAP